MTREQFKDPTRSSNDSWTWRWEDDFEDRELKGKISGPCQLKITRRGDEFFFKYTLANCINENTVDKLQVDVLISSPDDPTNFSLSRGSDEGVPETIGPKRSRRVEREGKLPKGYFKSGSIGQAGRHIFLPLLERLISSPVNDSQKN